MSENPFLELADLVHVPGEEGVAQTVSCKKCGEKLYDIRWKNSLERWSEIQVHFEQQHGIAVMPSW